MSKVYEITRDSHNRLCAEIAPDMTIGIKLLGEHEPRRIEKGIHAYVVLDVRTSFGPLRIRDIKVMWSQKNSQFFLRWRQWETGKIRDNRPEWLDVVGPLDPQTRQKVEDAIVAVFKQVLADSAKGTIAHLAGPELEALRLALEEQTEAAEKAATPA